MRLHTAKGVHKKMKRIVTLTCLALMTFLASSVLAQKDDASIKKHPGYVDFPSVSIFGEREAKIEVNLKEPMLQLVSKFVELEDEEMSDIMRKLRLVRVQVFDVDREAARKFADAAAETTKKLDSKGWERVVRVRDDGENIDVYIKPSADFEWVDGVLVMVVDENDEAIFVNIVGEIKPSDLQRLGDHFDIDELGDVDYKSGRRSRRN